MSGNVVMDTVLDDIIYAMAYLIALMAGMNSTVVSVIIIQFPVNQTEVGIACH